MTKEKGDSQHEEKDTSISLGCSGNRICWRYADCGEVSVGSMGWASGEAISALTKFVLEQGYGGIKTLVPTDTVPAVLTG